MFVFISEFTMRAQVSQWAGIWIHGCLTLNTSQVHPFQHKANAVIWMMSVSRIEETEIRWAKIIFEGGEEKRAMS